MTRDRGVPVTTVHRSLLDFATVATQFELERAIREAHAQWLVRYEELVRFAEQATSCPGAPALREALGLEAGARSRFERDFVDLCRAHGLELPLLNQEVAGVDVDFCWPAHALVVETDGYGTHATRHGFERDRENDAKLAQAGIRVPRFSRRQIKQRAASVVATVTSLGVPLRWPAP